MRTDWSEIDEQIEFVDPETVDDRDIRAAKESMTTYNFAPAMFEVYSGEKSMYVVGLFESCLCPSARFHEGRCKHFRRVEMELGLRPIPDLPGTPDVVHARRRHIRDHELDDEDGDEQDPDADAEPEVVA